MEPGDEPPGQPRTFRVEIMTISDDVESLQIIERTEGEELNENVREETNADNDSKNLQDGEEKAGNGSHEAMFAISDEKLSEELEKIANDEKRMLEEDSNFAKGGKQEPSKIDENSAKEAKDGKFTDRVGKSAKDATTSEKSEVKKLKKANIDRPHRPFYWNKFESNINQEELREAEKNVHPREFNYETTLVNITDAYFDKLMAREFATKLPTDVQDFVEDIKDFMDWTREKMVTFRRENQILSNIVRRERVEGNERWLNELYINLIVNRRKISKLEIQNDILMKENEAYQKEVLKFKPKDYVENNVLNLEDRREDFVEAGNSVIHLKPPRNRHMVPGNYIDCYDENGMPLPIGKLTHVLKLLSTANGTEVNVEKVDSGSPVDMDDDASNEEEEAPDVSPEMAVRLKAKQVAKHPISEKKVESKTAERKVSASKKQSRCISTQRPADISKLRAEVKAKFTQNKKPEDAKRASEAKKVKTTGVYLPPLNPFDDPEPCPASSKHATKPHRVKDGDAKPVKPPKMLQKKGLDCIKPNSELVYQGSLPLSTASAVVQSEPPKKFVPEPPKKPRPPTSKGKRANFRVERPLSSKNTDPVEQHPRKGTPLPKKNSRSEDSLCVEEDRPESSKDITVPTVRSETPEKPIGANKKMQADENHHSFDENTGEEVDRRSNGTPTQVPSRRSNGTPTQVPSRRSNGTPTQVASSIHFPQPPDSLVGKPAFKRRFVNAKSDVVLAQNPRPPSGKPTSRMIKGRASVSGAVLTNESEIDASKVANQRKDGETRTPSVRGSRSKDVMTPGTDARSTRVEGSPVALHTTILDLTQPVPQIARSSTKVIKNRPPTATKKPANMEVKGNDSVVSLPKIVGSTKVLNNTSPDRPSQASRMGLLNNASILPNRPVMRPPTPNKRRTTFDRTRSTPSPEGGNMQARSGTAASKSLGCIKEFSGEEDNYEDGSPV